MKKIIATIVFLFSLSPFVFASDLSLEADSLFKKYSPAIYQVQSISAQSGKKYSIGSGFQISKEGYIVTNYHVISDAVMTQESFFIRTVQPGGQEHPAQIINFDVIHDLAIIKIAKPQKQELPLGSSEISKGKKLFSIGNPEDVGMMIVEGVANGYMDKALYKKVLTSLPLNPGMSGGPALDEAGQVIGVNVMTAGNSLSFLVPVEFLKKLWEETKKTSFKPAVNFVAQTQEQLIEEENDSLKRIIGQKWEKQRFGNFLVPTTLSDEMTCWGAPRDSAEYWIESPYLACALKDDLFISSSQKAHTVLFDYSWVKSRSYNPFRFYKYNNEAFLKSYKFDLNEVFERDVENFECRTSIVEMAATPFWVSTCVRRLKPLPQLYDISVRMASLGSMDSLLMVELTLGAITPELAKEFLAKFYKEIEWAK